MGSSSHVCYVEGKYDRFQTLSSSISSNHPGTSGTVPDLLALSRVPEALPICPGKSFRLILGKGSHNCGRLETCMWTPKLRTPPSTELLLSLIKVGVVN